MNLPFLDHRRQCSLKKRQTYYKRVSRDVATLCKVMGKLLDGRVGK